MVKQIRKSIVVVALAALVVVRASPTGTLDVGYGNKDVKMNTNIAVIHPGEVLEKDTEQDMTVINPKELLDRAQDSVLDDIEEDDLDRFITSRKGKPRPQLVSPADVDDDWAESTISTPKVLRRVKRCHGGDDDNDVNRARSSRSRRLSRGRSLRSRGNGRKSKRKAKTTQNEVVTKTVRTQVYRNGVLVSDNNAAPTVVQAPAPQAPTPQAVVIQQQPAVSQPVVVQQQPAQQVVVGQPQIAVSPIPVQ